VLAYAGPLQLCQLLLWLLHWQAASAMLLHRQMCLHHGLCGTAGSSQCCANLMLLLLLLQLLMLLEADRLSNGA
jgi:hypothetical protein